MRGLRDHRFRALATLLLGVVILIGAGDNSARVEKLGHKMICMCGCNQVLLECNHYGCPYLTPEHQELVAAVNRGDSDGSILQAFIDKYGTTVLAAPTGRGFDLVAWIMPYLVLIVGVGGIALIVRAWHKRFAGNTVPATSGMSPADISRLREQARKETDL